jgi:hypothetical protein
MDLEQLLEEAEPVDGGVTNDVWATNNEVIKRYSDTGFLDLGFALEKVGTFEEIRRNGLLNGLRNHEEIKESERIKPDVKVENEKSAADYFAGRDLVSTPEILHEEIYEGGGFPEYEGSEFLVFENLDADSFGGTVGDMGWDRTYDVSKKFGELMAEVHRDDCAWRDGRPENLMYNKDDGEFELYWIDNEYFEDDATEFEKNVDIATFLGEINTYHENKQNIVQRGFEEGYDRDIERLYDDSLLLDMGRFADNVPTKLSFLLTGRLIYDDLGEGKGANYGRNIIEDLEA